jgi:hypothetical protein
MSQRSATADTLTIDGRIYEIISFNTRITNKAVSVRGLGLAHGFLAISGADNSYRIYNTQSGEPLLRCRFLDFKEALQFARWIEQVYKDFFEIWMAYPEADLISWCKYSVADGARLFETIQLLNALEIVDNQEIARAHVRAGELCKRWKMF